MNRLFLLLFGMVTFVAHAQVPDYVPTEGLVAWWPLDGNATNFVGDNHGQIEGCLPTENRFGEASKALFFDGQNDRVSIDTFFGGQEMVAVSYSVWFNSNGSPDPQFLSGKEGFWRTIYIRLTSANDIRFGGTSQGVYFGVTSDEQAFTLGTWHHLVVTFEDAVITLFLDGNLIAQGSSAANLLEYQFYAAGNSTATNYFGATHPVSPGLCHFFSGKMDDFGLWNRALTEEEVLALYNAEPPVPGCTDPTACNFDAEAMSDDGSCIPSGCMEPLACNYNALAECAGEACDFTCCPGPGCCGPGTVWDTELQYCVQNATCIHDLDFDGVVGVNDLMELLSAFGTDCPEPEEPATTEWTCGYSVSYHGYDYATVQIGEQCWFAENLRTELYQNGDSIETAINIEEWVAGNNGKQVVYGNNDWGCQNLGLASFDVCDTELSLSYFGLLYNWHAVDDERKLCPVGWQVPNDSAFSILETFLGMPEEELFNLSWRGTIEGEKIKSSLSDTYSWNGSNTTGFSAVPAGSINSFFDTPSGGAGYDTVFWTSSYHTSSYAWYRALNSTYQMINRNAFYKHLGASVRCLKD